MCSHSRCECPSGNCPETGEQSPDTVSASGDSMYFDDATIETTVPLQAGDYRRVDLDVLDDKARPAHISVVFQAM